MTRLLTYLLSEASSGTAPTSLDVTHVGSDVFVRSPDAPPPPAVRVGDDLLVWRDDWAGTGIFLERVVEVDAYGRTTTLAHDSVCNRQLTPEQNGILWIRADAPQEEIDAFRTFHALVRDE